MANTNSFSTRAEIPEQFKWDFSHIYDSPADWQVDFEAIQKELPEYSVYKGKVAESADTLLAVLKLDEQVGIKLGKLYLYAFLTKDVDMGNEEAKTRFGKVQSLAAQASSASAYIIPEIIAADEQTVLAFSEKAELQEYSHFLSNLLRKKAHTLSAEVEQAISELSPISSAPYNSFSLLKSTDIEFPKITIEGQETQLSDGKYSSLMYHNDASVREEVYRNYYKPYIGHKNTIASLLDTAIKAMTTNAKLHKYENSLEASLFSNNIPVDFFDTVIQRSKTNAPQLQRWAELKARLLAKEKISPFDTYVSLFKKGNENIEYGQVLEDVYKALSPLGEQYINDVKDAVDKRRIDVYETPGKRSGAYSSGTTYGVVPYVLLNWNGTTNDIFTLVHELGHNMHSLYTGQSQPYIYAGYSIFLAEVASITNEALLHRYLENRAETTEEKLYLHELFLNKCITTFYRQLQFADFERKIHERVETGIPLTPEYLCEEYGASFKDYWGESVHLEPEESYSWTRIPHFYYNFYVYQYATGLVAGEWLAEKIYEGDEKALENYLSFLHAGRSDYPMEILASAGADLREEAPFENLFKKMSESLDFIEKNI